MADKVVRQFAERGAAAADETKKGMEQAYTTASKGTVDLSLQVIHMDQANMNAGSDCGRELARAQAPSECLELSTAQARKQWELLMEQAQKLTAMAQKVTTDAAQPLQAGISKAFNQTFSKST